MEEEPSGYSNVLDELIDVISNELQKTPSQSFPIEGQSKVPSKTSVASNSKSEANEDQEEESNIIRQFEIKPPDETKPGITYVVIITNSNSNSSMAFTDSSVSSDFSSE